VFSETIEQHAVDFIFRNFLLFQSESIKILEVTIDQTYTNFDQINLLIIETLVAIVVVSFIVVLLIFPAYLVVQSRRQNILRLFGAFPPE
jgi:hypothetical protein